jgi:arylsulfatase A-like enzyme
MLLLVVSGAVGQALLSRRTVPAPNGQRLVDLLPSALEVPPAPKQQRWLHLDAVTGKDARPLGLFVPLEAARPFVVRLRVKEVSGRHSSAELRAVTPEEAKPFARGPTPIDGPLPGEELGACLEIDPDVPGSTHLCQRAEELSVEHAGVLIVIANADVGVTDLDVFDSALPDMREPRSPLLGPLVRRWFAKTSLGRRGMTGLAAPPIGQYSFDVVLPAKPSFRASVRHEPGRRAAPMQFEIRQDGRVLLDEVIAPDRVFHDYEWPLIGAPGAHSRITMLARPAPGSTGEYRGLWMNPRVVGASTAPNIVLVSIDALRPDHLSAYGYPRDTSPNLEKLLHFGVRFDRATAQAGTTWESVTSLLSGLYPVHNGVRARGRYPLPGTKQLADILSEAGYETFAGAHAADFPPEMLTAFDEDEFLARNMKEPQVHHDLTPSILARQTTEAIQRAGAHPLFLWLHLDQPHYPLLPSEPNRYDQGYAGRFADKFLLPDHATETVTSLSPAESKHVTALYDASVRDADAGLGAVLGVLSEAGVLENTIVVVTADHGELIGQRGVLLDHTVPYDSVLHVPLVIAWPGGLSTRSPVPTRVQLVDLAPTLLSLAGVLPPVGLDGRDLSPALHGGSLLPRPAFSEVTDIFSRYDEDQHFLYNPHHYTLKYAYPVDVPIAETELYDVAHDPGEVTNLARLDGTRTVALTAKLKDELGGWLEPGGSDSRAGMSQDVLDALTQAGYLQAAMPKAATRP